MHGVATRKVDDLVTALGVDSGISKLEVSRICANLDEEINAWLARPLDHTAFRYMFLVGRVAGGGRTRRLPQIPDVTVSGHPARVIPIFGAWGPMPSGRTAAGAGW